MKVNEDQHAVDATPPAVKVVGICGSLRPGSYTRAALHIALKGAAEIGASTQLIDLRDYELSFCDGSTPEGELHPDVLRLRDQVKAAQGIILGTPEYHGSFSGVLKNALDLMGFDEFEGKMMGLVGVAAGRMGALHALNSLRTIGRSLHAWLVPEQVSIPTAWKIFNDAGELQDEELEERLMDIGRQVARFSYLHNSKKALDFLKAWEVAPSNPGGIDR